MAHLHTPLPSGDGMGGERIHADAHVAFGGDDTHLWFGVNYLAGVTDLDAIVAVESLGVFVIEVKGIPLSEIELYGQGSCKIRNRPGSKTPLQQALKGQQRLVQFLRSSSGMKHIPFVHVTAAFPRIRRSDFIAKWSHPGVIAQAKSMIFEEDLRSAESLRSVLVSAVENPPIGGGDERRFPLTVSAIHSMAKAISPDEAVGPTSNDVERMRVVERSLNTTRRQYVQPTEGAGIREALFSGPPGTGKTFRLLEIALGHARAGRNVVLACHNKVLSSELRRMLLADVVTGERAENLDVLDVHQLLERYPNASEDHDSASGFDGWVLAKVRRLIRDGQPTERFGTVLVDEAQDVEDWMYDLLRWSSAPDSEWFVAQGRGQALYRDEAASWLSAYKARVESAKRAHRMQRVYRSGRADHLVARCTHEVSPELDGVAGFLARHPVVENQMTLDLGGEEFDRLGEPTALVNLPALPDELTVAEYRDGMVRSYAAIIREELALLEKLGAPGDLAILVPKPHAHQQRGTSGDYLGRRVAQALDIVGCPYIDQVDSDARRSIRPEGAVRIVTYHSSRGIEASRVLILGFEELGRSMGGPLPRQRNLAYVALTRAKFGCRVGVSAARTGPHLDFLQVAAGAVRRELALAEVSPAPVSAPTTDQISWEHGEIVRYVADRGFGFISCSEREVFFHISSVFGMGDPGVQPGQLLWFASGSAGGKERVTFAASRRPDALQEPALPGLSAALVAEPIGDRGIGFVLSPDHGRVLLHKSVVDGTGDGLAEGARVDIEVEAGSDARLRATRAVIR